MSEQKEDSDNPNPTAKAVKEWLQKWHSADEPSARVTPDTNPLFYSGVIDVRPCLRGTDLADGRSLESLFDPGGYDVCIAIVARTPENERIFNDLRIKALYGKKEDPEGL